MSLPSSPSFRVLGGHGIRGSGVSADYWAYGRPSAMTFSVRDRRSVGAITNHLRTALGGGRAADLGGSSGGSFALVNATLRMLSKFRVH